MGCGVNMLICSLCGVNIQHAPCPWIKGRGGGMYKGGGPWPYQNSEIFLNIYTIILIFSKFSLQK